MKYHEFQLDPLLTDYIQSIWGLESESENDEYPRSLIMPDGIVEIIFHYQNPFYTWQDSKQFLQPECFAISMMQKFVEIASNGKAGFVSVRFYPWGAYHFFDKPIQHFLDQTIEAGKLWGNDAEKIIDKIKNKKAIHERFEIIQQFLLDKLDQFSKADTNTDNAVKLIRETKGMLSIEAICDRTGFSKKQLERKFLSTVGTTPKLFSRITRFLNICQNLEEQKDKTLTQLTHECGFYDQAHFIKEFKAFSGFTPKEFYDKENIYFSEI
ncbi:MAG: helix-turn-helix transcriptional regulator [Ferruginibacter sp.]